MSLKASSLKYNDQQIKAINKEVSLILGHIDDELKVAHEQGKHNISISLPISFSIPYMNNKDSQRSIYYRVLKSLLDREFNSEIELTQNSTIFHITWLSKDEMRDLEVQNAILAKYTKK